MGVLIDADVLIRCEKVGEGLATLIRGREEEEVFLSVVTASELLHGVWRAVDPTVRLRRSQFVEAVLGAFPVLGIDLPVARVHAELWADLAGRGQMIGLHDSWLAATCLAKGLGLVTCNGREFGRVQGLKMEVWGV